MTRFRRITLIVAVLVVAVLAAVAWTATGPTASAQAAEAVACCCNPGVFTGTDTNGSFENAIAAAVAKADACAGCCDRRIEYRVTQITGVVGGIAAQNDITVEIVATW